MIPPEHLKIETYHPRPPGGQQVGMDCGVRVEHLPSGIFCVVDIGRSQHRNREIAIDMIEAAITHPMYR